MPATQQWPQGLLDVEEAMAFNDQIPDVYWLQGFAYCNLDDEATAEAAYTTAVELDPTFVLPYLNRAGLRLHQGDTEGAEADFQAIADSELSAEFAPVIPFVRSGQLTCKNFLTFGQ
jgi:Flp pilus assembly protein TadD